MTKVALFHTSVATLPAMQTLTRDIMPDVQVMHLIEESMIKEVMAQGGVTPEISARIAGYVQIAERAGCSIFMTSCSSIGWAVEQCQFMTPMRVTRIDTAMVDEALQLGRRISVLATVATTLDPTLEFIQRKAKLQHKDVEIITDLMPDAFTALLAGDMAQHDQLVQAGLQRAYAHSDVIVLAQASMARVLNDASAPPVPVLTSPERGIRWLHSQLTA